jgi:hypothetical protein
MWLKRIKINRLIKAKLTGIITVEQEIKLNSILRNSKEEQIRFMKILEIEKQLKEVKIPDESIGITSEVLQKISTHKPIELETNVFRNIISPLPVRFAAVLVIGLLLGSAIGWIVTSKNLTTGTENLMGSLTTPPDQAISYSHQNNLIKMIPYQIGNMHYLNFVLNTRSKINMEVMFEETNMKLIEANYIASGGNESINLYTGSLTFAATGKTSFQIIFEKFKDVHTDITITAQQNQSPLITKQISFE